MNLPFKDKGHIGLYFIGFIFAVTLWKHVMSQCSEAHAVACSWSLLNLRHYEGLLQPLGGFLPDYNDTTLTDICGLFQSYMNCSQPFLQHCNNNTILQLYELESAFNPLCKYSKEYISHRSCYKRLEKNFDWCQDERKHKLGLSKTTADTQYHLYMCNVTNEYVQCIFTATFLRCSMAAANVYFDIINQSVSSVMKRMNLLPCTISHPLDVILAFTTTTSTPTRRTTPVEPTKTTDSVLESTSKNSHHTSSTVQYIPNQRLIACIFIIKTLLLYYVFLWT